MTPAEMETLIAETLCAASTPYHPPSPCRYCLANAGRLMVVLRPALDELRAQAAAAALRQHNTASGAPR